jgi:hypothetical protein
VFSALRAGEPCAIRSGNLDVFFDNFWRIAYFVSIMYESPAKSKFFRAGTGERAL